MPTIRDVAARAGVSTATVSAVLNDSAYVSPALTERVRKAVRELNYTINAVARGLQSRSTRLIGMLVPDIAEPVYSRMVKGVEQGLKPAGYSLLLASTHNRGAEQSRHLELLRSKQVDGMLALLAFGPEDDLRQAVEAGLPMVFLARKPATFTADCVVVDNIAASRRATGELLAAGHRRIGILVGPRELVVSQDRIDGWRRALVDAGIPAREEWIFEGDYTASSGEAAMERLLALDEPPTALFAAGFLMMTGCLAVARRRGLVLPDDIELMTWSDSPLLNVFDPPIAAVEQPSVEMGVRAAELILRRIKEPHREPEIVTLPAGVTLRAAPGSDRILQPAVG